MKLMTFALFFLSFSCFGLGPSAQLKTLSKIGFVANYEDQTGNVMISKMPSDISFKDLNSQEVDKLEDAIELKKEYGKMFGFNDWKMVGKKYLEEENEKLILLEGNFKNDDGKLVSFIEVYWADKKDSNQFLITSEKQSLKMDAYKEYLVK